MRGIYLRGRCRLTLEDQAQLDAELSVEEGNIAWAYDDATGARIVPGYTVKGNVTAGVGTNLQFLYPEEITFLLHNREQRAIKALLVALPWFGALDAVRSNALVDLYYNVPAFVKWPRFTGFCAVGDWNSAAVELMATEPWASQVKGRSVRIADALRTGAVPSVVS